MRLVAERCPLEAHAPIVDADQQVYNHGFERGVEKDLFASRMNERLQFGDFERGNLLADHQRLVAVEVCK